MTDEVVNLTRALADAHKEIARLQAKEEHAVGVAIAATVERNALRQKLDAVTAAHKETAAALKTLLEANVNANRAAFRILGVEPTRGDGIAPEDAVR